MVSGGGDGVSVDALTKIRNVDVAGAWMTVRAPVACGGRPWAGSGVTALAPADLGLVRCGARGHAGLSKESLLLHAHLVVPAQLVHQLEEIDQAFVGSSPVGDL